MSQLLWVIQKYHFVQHGLNEIQYAWRAFCHVLLQAPAAAQGQRWDRVLLVSKPSFLFAFVGGQQGCLSVLPHASHVYHIFSSARGHWQTYHTSYVRVGPVMSGSGSITSLYLLNLLPAPFACQLGYTCQAMPHYAISALTLRSLSRWQKKSNHVRLHAPYTPLATAGCPLFRHRSAGQAC